MQLPQESSDPSQAREILLTSAHVRWIIFLLVVAIALTAFFLRGQFDNPEEAVERLGYPAVFLMSLLASGGLVVPLPGAITVFAAGNLLNPLLVGLIAGAAEALGETTGYGLGFSGQNFVNHSRFYGKIHTWVEKRGWPIIVVVSIIPNPFFDALGIAAGALRYPFRLFMLSVWAGKTVKNLGIAYAGALGADWVTGLFL